jgi:hypothetical protein
MMSDTEFGLLMEDPEAGLTAVSQQAVSLWRKGKRTPSSAYRNRIKQLTKGAVVFVDRPRVNADEVENG